MRCAYAQHATKQNPTAAEQASEEHGAGAAQERRKRRPTSRKGGSEPFEQAEPVPSMVKIAINFLLSLALHVAFQMVMS